MVRVYDGRFLRSLDLRAMDTEINTEIIYKAQILHARIVEIPAHLDWSFASTGGTRRAATNFRFSRSTISSLFSSFLFRPFLFFMLPGLILLASPPTPSPGASGTSPRCTASRRRSGTPG